MILELQQVFWFFGLLLPLGFDRDLMVLKWLPDYVWFQAIAGFEWLDAVGYGSWLSRFCICKFIDFLALKGLTGFDGQARFYAGLAGIMA